MATKITRDILESFLNCRLKGHLKLTGQQGTKCDYEILRTELRAEVRLAAIDKIIASHPSETIPRNVELTTPALKQGATFIIDATFTDDNCYLMFDGLKKVDGPSVLGDFHYIPVLFCEGEVVRKEQKILLAACGTLLAAIQGTKPTDGIVWHGKECKATRVRLTPNDQAVAKLLGELMEKSKPSPSLMLNEHCQICEYCQTCNARATKEDHLSLLRGMSANEIRRQNQKGIFTVTQLSYTFRTRRQRKRVKQPARPHHFALQALAIREKKVFVHGSPTLSSKSTRVYFDIEGDDETGLYYLIGLIAVVNGIETKHSFWANNESEKAAIFCQLLDFLSGLPDYSLIHYGSYETTALRRMKASLPEPYHLKVDDAIKQSMNLVSVISPFVYFPTYSNGLKDLGRYLGHEWSQPFASGIQSIVWRRRWEERHDESLKQVLLRYNLEDCQATRKVAEFIETVVGQSPTDKPSVAGLSLPVSFTKDLPKRDGKKHVFKKAVFALSDLSYVNKCAYFDYQRDRVFARSDRSIRKSLKRKQIRNSPSIKLNKVAEYAATECPKCKSSHIYRQRRTRRLVIDLLFFKNGVKRWTVRHVSWRYRCLKCGNRFIPRGFPERSTKYGHGLISWCIYHNVALGQNILQVQRGLLVLFKLRCPEASLYRFKTAVAQFYQVQYGKILGDILRAPVLHIDETEVDLRSKKGYVWVITSLDSVYYFFKESREGSFLKDFLKGFDGVLISDFYTAYDSLDCPQQRCLIHLMRDLNDDLLKSPFNDEFKEFASRFSFLMKTIIETIDKYGLKKRHLRKHKAAVSKFFDWIMSNSFLTEPCQRYQKRFQKYEAKLFAFLDFDGVPWNNNNAEHAMKVFAKYRRFADGCFSDLSIREYLVILSIYQTCEYRGIDFLQFMLAEESERGMKFGSGIRIEPTACPEDDHSSITHSEYATIPLMEQVAHEMRIETNN